MLEISTEQLNLWNRIEEFELDNPESEFSFSDRLARENGWSLQYALRCTEEYKRFIFLICCATHPLTPSDQVDQVWHLHLLYTKSYWVELCQNTLQRQIHHGPTEGGQKEKDKFKDWYEETKKFYYRVFNESPPADIWPSSKVRFGELNFTRVNRHRNWVVPKIKLKR